MNNFVQFVQISYLKQKHFNGSCNGNQYVVGHESSNHLVKKQYVCACYCISSRLADENSDDVASREVYSKFAEEKLEVEHNGLKFWS